MNIRLFKWERALAIANKNKQHIDTVLWYRRKFLSSFDRREDIPAFDKYKDKELDEAAIQEDKARSKEAERNDNGSARK